MTTNKQVALRLSAMLILFCLCVFILPANSAPCDGKNCQNGGTCQNVISNRHYYCKCKANYEGRHCEQMTLSKSYKACYHSKNHNGGHCKNLGSRNGPSICLKHIADNKAASSIPQAFGLYKKNYCCWGNLGDLDDDGKTYGHCDWGCPGDGGNKCGGDSKVLWNTYYYWNTWKINKDSKNCGSQTCKNGGKCVEKRGDYDCLCTSGWEGKTCSTNTDECASTPCKHPTHTTCVDKVNGYQCECGPGFKGDHCETDVDECLSNPCQQNGKCINLDNKFTCDCSGTGYSGTLCTEDVNECDSSPCRNGAACNNKENKFTCDCPNGFEGAQCDQDIDDCSPNPCKNSGKCGQKAPGQGYFCTCGEHYTGTKCQTNINDCASSPCKNNGVCVDGVGSYTCDCSKTNFRGTHCELPNQCNPDPCQNAAACSMLSDNSQYYCTCDAKNQGRNCEETLWQKTLKGCYQVTTGVTPAQNCAAGDKSEPEYCMTTYIEPLAASPPEIMLIKAEKKDPSATYCCYGTEADWIKLKVGAVSCNIKCAGDPSLDCAGATTKKLQYSNVYAVSYDSDVGCATNPCVNGKCVEKFGTYECICHLGWEGANCDQDILECASSPCKNHGTCQEGTYKYTCNCAAGYKGGNCETFDVCHSSPCKNGAKCNDAGKEYSCTCTAGYIGKTCDEKDNCIGHNCQNGDCVNGKNSFSCACKAGYTSPSCSIDINECASIVCQNGAKCKDLIGKYKCDCLEGWSGNLCQNAINECDSNPCQNGATCTDKHSGYECACKPGYKGTHCEIDINECASSPCKRGTCRDLENKWRCDCEKGWKGDTCDIDINECESSPCKNDATCQDLDGKYKCVCKPGWEGGKCHKDINECKSNPCQHGATCHNKLNDLYTCECAKGWMNTNCETEINECLSVVCQNGGTCNDHVGKYDCSCKPGYTSFHCETDIDECASDPCKNGATCHQDVDLWKCDCVPGYTSYNCKIDINECESDPCVNGTCLDMVNMFNCSCVPGYEGIHCDKEIDECLSTPCHYGGSCTDYVNEYTCDCVQGTTGTYCEINIDECLSSPCDAKDNNATCLDGINGFKCACGPKWTNPYCDLDLNIWLISQKFSSDFDLSALEDVLSQASTIVDSVPFIVGGFNSTQQMSLSWNYTDLIAYCSYGGKNCDVPHDTVIWFEPSMGNCFTFNHKSVFENYGYKVSRAGVSEGLLMYLSAGQSDYAPWVDVAGVRIFVHNQSDSVNAESVGYAIPPGFETSLGVQWTEYARIKTMYKDCIDNKKELPYYYYPGSYSTEGCLRSCYQNTLNAELGCMDPRYPSPAEGNRCGLEKRKDVNKFIEVKGDKKYWDCKSVRDCPLPCHNGEYTVTATRTKFRKVPIHCEVYENEAYRKECIKQTFSNTMRLEVYFEQSSFVKMTETRRYTEQKLLSNIGGQLGILCGMSVISMTELFFACMQMIFVAITGVY